MNNPNLLSHKVFDEPKNCVSDNSTNVTKDVASNLVSSNATTTTPIVPTTPITPITPTTSATTNITTKNELVDNSELNKTQVSDATVISNEVDVDIKSSDITLEKPKDVDVEHLYIPVQKTKPEIRMTEKQMFEKALELYNDRNYDESKHLFDRIKNTNPQNVKAKEMSKLLEGLMNSDSEKTHNNRDLMRQALASASKGNFIQAKKHIDDILSKNPDDVNAKKLLETLKLRV